MENTQSVRTYVSGGHMMPATLPRFWWSLLLGSLALALTGCGAVGTFHVGGNLTQSGNSLSGTMYVAGSLCFDVSQPISLTGTINRQKVTLASTDINGQVFS